MRNAKCKLPLPPGVASADSSSRATMPRVRESFPTTRYSIVTASASDNADVRRPAFDALVTAYWKPVFKYARVKWHATPDEAADLTQAFFLRAFEKDFFGAFD